MIERIRSWFKSKLATRTVVRLDEAILADLRRKAGVTAVVTNQTTEHMAGYQLGVQHVLNVLAEGFTVKSS